MPTPIPFPLHHTLHARILESSGVFYYRLWSEAASQYLTPPLTAVEMGRRLVGEVPLPVSTEIQPFVPVPAEEALLRLLGARQFRAADRTEVFPVDFEDRRKMLNERWLPETGRGEG